MAETIHVPAISREKINIEVRTGDIFANPLQRTVFIHSCNCQGQWGKGIALELKDRFPEAFKVQQTYCLERISSELLGKSMLVPGAETDSPGGQNHMVACLFTKSKPGAVRTEQETLEVLRATRVAMQHLLDGIASLIDEVGLTVHELRMPRLNSGLFNVEWQRTLGELAKVAKPILKDGAEFPNIALYTIQSSGLT